MCAPSWLYLQVLVYIGGRICSSLRYPDPTGSGADPTTCLNTLAIFAELEKSKHETLLHVWPRLKNTWTLTPMFHTS